MFTYQDGPSLNSSLRHLVSVRIELEGLLPLSCHLKYKYINPSQVGSDLSNFKGHVYFL